MNDFEYSHRIDIAVSGNYPHGPKQHASISVSGQGDLDHFIGAFKAALIASGYSADSIKRLEEALK